MATNFKETKAGKLSLVYCDVGGVPRFRLTLESFYRGVAAYTHGRPVKGSTERIIKPSIHWGALMTLYSSRDVKLLFAGPWISDLPIFVCQAKQDTTIVL